MFHAHIRTAHDAFHLIAEVNSYNLQTLRQHMRQTIREDGQVKISVQIDSSDQPAFARHTANWLPKLIEAGTQVEVVVASPGRQDGGRDPLPGPLAPSVANGEG